MKANRCFHLTVTRGGHEPALVADPQRRDLIEVVAIDEGEPILYWELPAREAASLAKRLREDLGRLEAAEFLALWEDADRVGQ